MAWNYGGAWGGLLANAVRGLVESYGGCGVEGYGGLLSVGLALFGARVMCWTSLREMMKWLAL